jgi:hypothetical protein
MIVEGDVPLGVEKHIVKLAHVWVLPFFETCNTLFKYPYQNYNKPEGYALRNLGVQHPKTKIRLVYTQTLRSSEPSYSPHVEHEKY